MRNCVPRFSRSRHRNARIRASSTRYGRCAAGPGSIVHRASPCAPLALRCIVPDRCFTHSAGEALHNRVRDTETLLLDLSLVVSRSNPVFWKSPPRTRGWLARISLSQLQAIFAHFLVVVVGLDLDLVESAPPLAGPFFGIALMAVAKSSFHHR